MIIQFIEIANFRKLHAARLDIADEQTLLVGANNSGKTSAMVALRLFLKERTGFSMRDITASNWAAIEEVADSWKTLSSDDLRDPEPVNKLLPLLDVWFSVEDSELHHVSHLIPSLDWNGGLLGVRTRLEIRDFDKLLEDYQIARAKSEERIAKYQSEQEQSSSDFSLWPKSFHDYLERRFSSVFTLQAYLLDPNMVKDSSTDQYVEPQTLPSSLQPIGSDPFKGLMHIREINAQRGFTDASERGAKDNDSEAIGGSTRRLSDQLQAYYKRHLDPDKNPSDDDVSALGAFHKAQQTFDQRLEQGFHQAIGELEQLGYPGIANPKLSISTRLRPTDGLDHPSAVQYDIGGAGQPIRLPEDYSGLGFQNLISMVFQLMRFRDEWMRVGKLSDDGDVQDSSAISPLQLILVEEPEAHLHAQVQQVFIRRAYNVLRNHNDLGESQIYRTQMIVSSHSSHVAHEVDFESLRYFKRCPAEDNSVPTSVVVNLTNLFGGDSDTTRFVRRYIKTTHCDLFFADGMILVEGAAERMLVPNFIQRYFPDLTSRYITLLEIGGSHAHRLRPLVEILSIPTLIIADIDAVDPSDNNKSVIPSRSKNQITSNNVLKTWAPQKSDIDDLLNEPPVSIAQSSGAGFVGVVYQREIQVRCRNQSKDTIIVPSTFEDSIVASNPFVIASLSGVTMTNAFAKIIKNNNDINEISEKLFLKLRDKPEKSAFALDILMSEKLYKIKAPSYIKNGLSWLQAQLGDSENPA